jgi:hypothetical protein
MRKLKAKNTLPESQRPRDVRDRDTGVISRNDVKRRAHAVSTVSAGVSPAESLVAAGTAATTEK